MVKPIRKFAALIIAAISILACNQMKQVDLDIEVNVTLDGQPAAEAKVRLDGSEIGTTDAAGRFSLRIKRQPGEEIRLSVYKEAAGYRIEPWEQAFVAKIPKTATVEKYPFAVELKATKYFTMVVVDDEDGQLLEGASIRIADENAGQTNDHGEYVHEYTRMPAKGLKLQIAKKGYTRWQKDLRAEPGQRLEIALSKKSRQSPARSSATVESETQQAPVATAAADRKKMKEARISIAALTEAYGVSRGISGAAVSINGKKVGSTNSRGEYRYTYRGGSQDEVKVKISAPGYIPEQWEATVHAEGKPSIQHYFYPARPNPIKAGLYGYVNNSPGEDLTEILGQIESEVGSNLFGYGCFREMPRSQLRESMLQAGLDMETVSTKGWQHTALIKSVDMLISGSVTHNEGGLRIETTVIAADGSILLSQINTARKEKNISNTAKLIANSIIDQLPFEGTVAAVDAQGYRINLGNSDYRIRRGNQFKYMVSDQDPSGRIKGYHEGGTLRVVETDDSASWAEVVTLNAEAEIKVGDRVVRNFYLDEKRNTEKASLILSAKGGLPPDDRPLWGVNVYLNNTWVGTTGSGGQVQIPLNLYEEYEILLSRHGYRPLQDTVSVDASQQTKEFFLEIANALFKVESQPSGADVFIDGVQIGQTPIRDGKLVNFGFHKVKLSAGSEYRDWEQVVEFNKPEVELIGPHQIVFLKDYMKMGKAAEQNGNIDAAIAAYSRTEKDNPDYSNAHHRLAQLYMDEKKDYDAAIREYENVLSLPQNKQIIYKQFAVTYTNLGHAYYEKGQQQLTTDKNAAASSFAMATKNLSIAKQNTRFFPNSRFDEAVHDTYYYLALALHKLYQVTQNPALVQKANLAWREYFDFFPKNLEASSSFVKIRESARKYWDQIKDLS